MKKICLLVFFGVACVLSLASPDAVWAGRNVLSISNHTGSDLDIKSVTCDGQAFGFPAITLSNDRGTSEASELLQSGRMIEVKGKFHYENPVPGGRTASDFVCNLPLQNGASCSHGIRSGNVIEIDIPDFDAWRIEFK